MSRIVLNGLAGATLLGLLALAILAPLPQVDNAVTAWFPQDDPHLQAYSDYAARFGADEVVLVELSGSDLGGLLRVEQRLEAALLDCRGVEQVLGPARAYPEEVAILADPELGGADARARLAWTFEGPLNKNLRLLEPEVPRCRVVALLRPGPSSERAALDARLHRFRYQETAGCRLRVAGQPLVNHELDRAGREVKEQTLPLLGFACFLLLWIMTRSLVRTAVLLAVVGLCLPATEGLLALSGQTTNLVVTVTTPLVFVILLAGGCHLLIAVDERRRMGLARADAAWGAAGSKARPCLLALATTAVGFGSLILSDVAPIRTFGWLSAAGLALGAPALLLLLPAVLAWVDPGAVSPGRLSIGAQTAALARLGDRRAAPILALAAGLVIAAGVGARGIEGQPHAILYFPPEQLLRADHEDLQASGAPLAQLEAVITGASPLTDDPPMLRRLDTWAQAACAEPEVGGYMSLPLLIREAGYRTARVDRLAGPPLLSTLLTAQRDAVAPYTAEGGRALRVSFTIATLDAEQLDALTRKLREQFAQEVDPKGHLALGFTGSYVLLLRTQRSLLDTLILSLLVTAVLMQLVLMAALRSARLGLAALIPNLLPVAAILGAMAAFELPLDVGTCMTTAIALGIAVDDTLHFLFAWRCGGLEHGARTTGRAIVLSSLVIAAGFLAITSSSFVPTRNFGLLCATAMGAALVGDLVVLPAALRVFAPRAPSAQGEGEAASALDPDQQPQPVAHGQ